MVSIQPNFPEYAPANGESEKVKDASQQVSMLQDKNGLDATQSAPQKEDKFTRSILYSKTLHNLSFNLDFAGDGTHTSVGGRGPFYYSGARLGYQRDLLSVPLKSPNHQLVLSASASAGFARFNEIAGEKSHYFISIKVQGDEGLEMQGFTFNTLEEAQAHHDKWMASDQVMQVSSIQYQTLDVYQPNTYFNGKVGGGLYYVNSSHADEENARVGITGGYHTLFNAPYIGGEIQGILPTSGGFGLGLGIEKTLGVKGVATGINLHYRIGTRKYS